MIQLLGSTPSLSAHQLSTPLLLGIGALALVELALLVLALISLIKRPTAEVRFHTNWPWAVLIVVIGLIGPLVYLAVGRIDASRSDDVDAGDAPAAERAQHAADLLYGPKTDE
jgi:Phospholipase_D-nuclease N-terminal